MRKKTRKNMEYMNRSGMGNRGGGSGDEEEAEDEEDEENVK